MEIEKHPLEPFLPAKAKLLMLGSFPPQKKRWSMDFYYPNLNNDMWRIFGVLFFNDKDYFLNPTRKAFCRERIIDFLNEKGIALFDTASSVRRLQDNASDKFLEVVEATDIAAMLRRLPECKAIVINQFVFYGEQVKVKVIDIDNVHHQARLSLKAVAKKRRFRKRKSIVETPKGFNPLREMMPRWISRGIAKEEDV